MISWLFIIILSYLFFGLFAFGDKLMLSGSASPKSYTFWVGVLNISAVALIPFAKFGLPNAISALWIVLDAVVFLVGLYCMFLALGKFEVSRVAPTIGALQPMIIFFLAWIFFGFQSISQKDFIAFVILTLGTFLISKSKSLSINREYVLLTTVAALMFSLDYIFAKIVFLNQPFLQGLIWTRVCIAVFSLVFLFDAPFRKRLFTKKSSLDAKGKIIFLLTQVSGAIANFLQSFAISLAPVTYLAVMNSLRGVQYVFLFVITLACSIFLPNILQEKVSGWVIAQKTVSIVFIVTGLALLVGF